LSHEKIKVIEAKAMRILGEPFDWDLSSSLAIDKECRKALSEKQSEAIKRNENLRKNRKPA